MLGGSKAETEEAVRIRRVLKGFRDQLPERPLLRLTGARPASAGGQMHSALTPATPACAKWIPV